MITQGYRDKLIVAAGTAATTNLKHLEIDAGVDEFILATYYTGDFG